MFTGLIESVGTFRKLTRKGRAAELTVATELPQSELQLGESIAVNGVCLTVTGWGGVTVTFHTLQETLSRTNLGSLQAGDQVNLERALRLGDRLGGHLVSGHVDGTGRVLAIGRDGDDLALTVELSAELAPFVVMKGSIAINGTSLTVATLTGGALGVCIIPHTWTHTNLCQLKPGDIVNLETDLFGKYVLRQVELRGELQTGAPSAGVTMEMLAGAGFL